ncbi:hypothetical protein HID58_089929 [Brassica napus]|uniref:Uncharacterized protein n=1 Tax=Brassica napus TaxID=3708 RepID=A0ABQ7Y0G3_BRANA|nr:hypothetical protein HID58_089929 [Brassica napus]
MKLHTGLYNVFGAAVPRPAHQSTPPDHRFLNDSWAKVYGWLGWEYRKPARVPPSCPFKPNDNKVSVEIYSLRLVTAEAGSEGREETIAKPVVAGESGGVKQD